MLKRSGPGAPTGFSRVSFAMLGLLGFLVGCAGGGEPPEAAAGDVPASPPVSLGADHVREVDEWHSGRIERLRSPTGWLSLVGLYWLEEGENTFGSAEDNDLVFPQQAPPRAGTLSLEGGKVTLAAAPGVAMSSDGREVTVLPMASDAADEATRVELGSLQFYVLDREGRMGIRLKDLESPVRKSFAGIDRFPVEARWRVEARWEPYDPPRTVLTPNVLGTAFEEECPGAFVFTAQGQEIRLEPTTAAEGRLFLVFGDGTNGDSTYGGGRFLYVEAPQDGEAVVDFNRSYNPPCVFTPYATCPLARKENRVPIEIPAGEKMWGEKHDV